MNDHIKRYAEKIKLWRNDIPQFAKDVFLMDVTDQQRDLLNDLSKPNARVAVKSGHGTGKTCACAMAIWWHVMCFQDSKTPCTAPTEPQLRRALWPELHKLRNRADDWTRDQLILTTQTACLKGREEEQFAVARTASKDKPDALQGFHATNLLFVLEECFGIDDVMFEPMQGALSTEGARVLAIGNPTRCTGFMYDKFQQNIWNLHTLSCVDSPNVSPKYIDDAKRDYGENSDFYRVRVLGEFPKAAFNQLIGAELVDQCLERKVSPTAYSYAPSIITCDPARYGDDRAVIVHRQGQACKILEVFDECDLMTLARHVINAKQVYNADAVLVDVVGLGAGVVDYMRELGHDVIEVSAGSPAIDYDKYQNLRAEMWCKMQKWLVAGASICNDNFAADLKRDLTAPVYSITPGDKTQLERKEDMKKRGVRSPDLGDALALSFAVDVQKKNPEQSDIYASASNSVRDYEVGSIADALGSL